MVWGFKREKIIRISQRGGQEIPIFPSLSAKCTVLDYSSKQCESKKRVAEREGYDVEVIQADMTLAFIIFSTIKKKS